MSLAAAAEDYRRATEEFFDTVPLITDANLDAHVTGGWSPRQVVHHVADSETQSYVRLRRLLAEPPGSLIQGYDEAAWARSSELGYRDLPIEHSLAVIRSVRAASHDILLRLSDTDLERTATHSESGDYTLGTWLDIYTRHPREHRDQILEAIEVGG